MAVAACFTVFNPNRSRLGESIRALASEVDEIVLYDNGGARAFLESMGSDFPPVTVVGDGENVGLSRALNCGCGFALEIGADYVLLMDQDSVPEPGMVASLASHFVGRKDVAIVCPRILKEGEGPTGSPAEETEVPRAITSGSLLSLDAWRGVGGFDEDLFVDWVDYDFSATLRDHDYKIIRDESAFLRHQLGEATPATLPVPVFREGKVHLLHMLRTNHSELRRMDKARSWAISLSKNRSRSVMQEEMKYVALTVARDLLVEGNKWNLVRSYVLGFRRGRIFVKSRNREEVRGC